MHGARSTVHAIGCHRPARCTVHVASLCHGFSPGPRCTVERGIDRVGTVDRAPCKWHPVTFRYPPVHPVTSTTSRYVPVRALASRYIPPHPDTHPTSRYTPLHPDTPLHPITSPTSRHNPYNPVGTSAARRRSHAQALHARWHKQITGGREDGRPEHR